MAKRAATSELNHDNWDAEEESEDPGTFKPLSSSELKNRVIKKAKRSLVNKETSSTSSGASPFASFSGFSTSTASSNSPFIFLKKNSVSGDTGSPFSISANKDEKKENGNSGIEEKKEIGNTEFNKSESSNTSDKLKPMRSIEYYRQLQSLNESLMKWMQLHLFKNSCCDFTPVFNDYKKHLDTLNVTYPVQMRNIPPEEKKEFFKKPASVVNSSPVKKPKSDVNLGTKSSINHKNQDETDYGAHFSSNTTNTSTVSFGIKKTPTATSSISSGPTSSCQEESISEKKPFQFSFGIKNNSLDDSNSKPSTFASSLTANADSGTDNSECSEYVPPKNEFVAVKEEDAIYSKRCKLFFKKGDEYVERGIGILYLKQLDGKTQLLIRADTNLGNILLNIILSASLPMSRTGKNNVLLVCVPNPPVDPKETDSKEAIPFLIRVKTSEDADELLEMLNKHKS